LICNGQTPCIKKSRHVLFILFQCGKAYLNVNKT
jgi:hypothetical protein